MRMHKVEAECERHLIAPLCDSVEEEAEAAPGFAASAAAEGFTQGVVLARHGEVLADYFGADRDEGASDGQARTMETVWGAFFTSLLLTLTCAVLGDGKCFYRALIFAVMEQIVRAQRAHALADKLLKWVGTADKVAEAMGTSWCPTLRDNHEDMHMAIRQWAADLRAEDEGTEDARVAALIVAMGANDGAVIHMVQCLTASRFFRWHAEGHVFSVFYPTEDEVKLAALQTIFRRRCYAEDFPIAALTKELGCGLLVLRRDGTHLAMMGEHNMQADPEVRYKAVLLLDHDHYQPLYLKMVVPGNLPEGPRRPASQPPEDPASAPALAEAQQGNTAQPAAGQPAGANNKPSSLLRRHPGRVRQTGPDAGPATFKPSGKSTEGTDSDQEKEKTKITKRPADNEHLKPSAKKAKIEKETKKKKAGQWRQRQERELNCNLARVKGGRGRGVLTKLLRQQDSGFDWNKGQLMALPEPAGPAQLEATEAGRQQLQVALAPVVGYRPVAEGAVGLAGPGYSLLVVFPCEVARPNGSTSTRLVGVVFRPNASLQLAGTWAGIEGLSVAVEGAVWVLRGLLRLPDGATLPATVQLDLKQTEGAVNKFLE